METWRELPIQIYLYTVCSYKHGILSHDFYHFWGFPRYLPSRIPFIHGDGDIKAICLDFNSLNGAENVK